MQMQEVTSEHSTQKKTVLETFTTHVILLFIVYRIMRENCHKLLGTIQQAGMQQCNSRRDLPNFKT